MAREIRNMLDTIIDGILIRAGDIKSTIQIENRLLDGSYNVQTIGGPSLDIGVEFYCENASRQELQDYANSGTPIKIIYDDNEWVGIIRTGILPYEYVLPCKYKLTFTVLSEVIET